MLQINGKTFMNLQEAVQWLLDNNALPFQSSANYIANTEIGMGTIVNPSPAKVRIGSLIFFADSKVSTVTGLTENGFIVSDQYNDLVDDVVYVSNVAINASGHLIVTLSNGTDIDAGLIKQVDSFRINASQHLEVIYNDGNYQDLGAIFSGNVTISGDLTVSNDLAVGGNITGDSIVENMAGYSATIGTATNWTIEKVYIGAVKNGNKVTFAIALNLTKDDASASSLLGDIVQIDIPSAVGNKLYPTLIGGYYYLDIKEIGAFKDIGNYETVIAFTQKPYITRLYFSFGNLGNLTVGDKYYVRYEATFLLSDPLV